MAIDRDPKYRERVVRGKYRRLYAYLSSLQAQEWRASFSEIESILGFDLPASARRHRPWWANQRSGKGHSHALAWVVAGWETAEVDMDSETLLFRRRTRPEAARKPSLDEVWPVHPTAEWPDDLSLRREDMYAENPAGGMERNFAGRSFNLVGPIRPERDGRGALIEERPGSPPDVPLHKYGEGPFCRFRIAKGDRWRPGGVYVVTYGDAVGYVGESQNLAKVWSFIGRVTPSAVRYKGGQQTHCRINTLILNEATRSTETALWFHAVEDGMRRGELKKRLIAVLNPPWNLTSPG